MNTLFGFSLSQLAKIAAVVGVVASSAFAAGSYVQRLSTAETTIAETVSRLGQVDERLGFMVGEMRALRELVESAIRYSRLNPPKGTPHDRIHADAP